MPRLPLTAYINGRVHTVDSEHPAAEGFLVAANRFLAVGSSIEILGATGAGDRVVDLGGRTVTPGFIDAHVHFSGFSFTLTDVNLDNAATVEEAVAQVAAAAAASPAGAWIRGSGFNANVWPRWPDRHDLDAVAPNHPVVLRNKDWHSAWVNSRALELAGVTRETQSPPGGQIQRDSEGHPTGILQENAQDLIWAVVPERMVSECAAAMRLGQKVAHSRGVTGLHDMDGVDCWRALQDLRGAGELRLRMVKSVPESAMEAAIAAGLQSGMGDEWIRIGYVKIFSDGSLGSQTAHMLSEYEGGRPGYLGVPTHTPAQLVQLVRRAAENGLACAIHAIGDAANRHVLDALAASCAVARARGLRQRIEHVQLIHPDDLPRLAALDVIASVQPSHAPSDRYVADRLWGERAHSAYPFRTLTETGARLAFGSDVPVEPLHPLEGMYAAVARKRPSEPDSTSWYPEQCLSPSEALHGFTLGAAYAGGMEHLVGSITPGKLADFVVLDRDILSGWEDDMLQAAIVATIVGGEVVYGELPARLV